MRKSETFLLLCLFLSALVIVNCHIQNSNALRIVEINDGNPLYVDILDRWTYTEEGEVVEVETYSDWYANVEVVYVERGSGLPTYPTPYTARITEYTVTFTDITPTPPGETPSPVSLAPVKGNCNFLITADPEAKKGVVQSLKIIPKEWCVMHEGDVEEGRVLKAKITLKGTDEISGKEVSDEGYLTIDIGNYEDDPNKRGE
uniref:Uncharacterized protein n=1 Tax=candidate division WOR-3 bacterium TaxID=2052148 RepID=A0A7C6A9R9_UNCW3